jgi:cyclopropane fatty-acyl-phospholipid synthase-like methyltransferase
MSADRPWWESFFEGTWGELQAEGYPIERTRREVDFVSQALELSPGARVLDIPCGEGRHSIELASRGYTATGVDLSSRAISMARQRAMQQRVDAEFVHADMRSYAADNTFEAAFTFFGSFGYFSDADNLAFAKNIARMLTKGGRFLIDTHVMESLFPRFRERNWAWVNDKPDSDRVLEECKWDSESRRVVTKWTFVRASGVDSSVSSIRLYGYGELCDLLRAAGFREFRAFETGSAIPFKLGSPRLGLVAST